MSTATKELDMILDEFTDLEQLPLTVSVERAGQMLGISRSAAYPAVHAGELPVLRVGRRLLVPSVKLLALLGLDLQETA